ncbi:unnamed protein product [Prorocentrum cordatum]|uniref:Uncharacterized protein n=1 Tax=Prorocentrum cordatum TaxID=2364126 RepID=A0ABN9SW06_9DINO|nr:unnamed protein product [Polarella glacialis]
MGVTLEVIDDDVDGLCDDDLSLDATEMPCVDREKYCGKDLNAVKAAFEDSKRQGVYMAKHRYVKHFMTEHGCTEFGALGRWSKDINPNSGKETDMGGPVDETTGQGTQRVLVPVEDFVCWFDEAKVSNRLEMGDKDKKNPKQADLQKLEAELGEDLDTWSANLHQNTSRARMSDNKYLVKMKDEYDDQGRSDRERSRSRSGSRQASPTKSVTARSARGSAAAARARVVDSGRKSSGKGATEGAVLQAVFDLAVMYPTLHEFQTKQYETMDLTKTRMQATQSDNAEQKLQKQDGSYRALFPLPTSVSSKKGLDNIVDEMDSLEAYLTQLVMSFKRITKRIQGAVKTEKNNLKQNAEKKQKDMEMKSKGFARALAKALAKATSGGAVKKPSDLAVNKELFGVDVEEHCTIVQPMEFDKGTPIPSEFDPLEPLLFKDTNALSADVTSLISKWQQMQVGSGRKTACVPPDVATSVLTLVAKDFEGVQPSVFAGAAGFSKELAEMLQKAHLYSVSQGYRWAGSEAAHMPTPRWQFNGVREVVMCKTEDFAQFVATHSKDQTSPDYALALQCFKMMGSISEISKSVKFYKVTQWEERGRGESQVTDLTAIKPYLKALQAIPAAAAAPGGPGGPESQSAEDAVVTKGQGSQGQDEQGAKDHEKEPDRAELHKGSGSDEQQKIPEEKPNPEPEKKPSSPKKNDLSLSEGREAFIEAARAEAAKAKAEAAAAAKLASKARLLEETEWTSNCREVSAASAVSTDLRWDPQRSCLLVDGWAPLRMQYRSAQLFGAARQGLRVCLLNACRDCAAGGAPDAATADFAQVLKELCNQQAHVLHHPGGVPQPLALQGKGCGGGGGGGGGWGGCGGCAGGGCGAWQQPQQQVAAFAGAACGGFRAPPARGGFLAQPAVAPGGACPRATWQR